MEKDTRWVLDFNARIDYRVVRAMEEHPDQPEFPIAIDFGRPITEADLTTWSHEGVRRVQIIASVPYMAIAAATREGIRFLESQPDLVRLEPLPDPTALE